MSTVVVKSIDVAALRAAADRWARDLLSRRSDVEEIVVFGSFVEGTWSPGSDLDVLVVLNRADRPVAERIPDLLPGAFPVAVDLFPYTREEIAERAGSPVLSAAARSDWRYVRASA